MKPSVVSLGAGTQSSALLLLAIDDALPDAYARPELAVFADTGAEPGEVYEWLAFLTDLAEGSGVEVQTVGHAQETDLADVAARHIPSHVANDDGTTGMASRYCTSDWKVRPVKRAARAHMEAKGAKQLDMLLGMSLDEVHRMKPSRVGYITHRYPLIDLRWKRQDTINYVHERTGRTPPRSACTFCPYRSPREWARLRDTDPDGWQQAVEVDRSLRDPIHLEATGTNYDGTLYLHRTRVPLEDAVLIPEDAGQLALLDDTDGFGDVCEGGCGL